MNSAPSLLAVALLACAATSHAARPCEELALQIAAKLDAAGVRDYSLEIVPNELAAGEKVVGSCEGGTRKITYARVGTKQPADSAQQRHPDVLTAKVRASGADTFDFDVTVSSPYDTPQRYADAFRVMGKDGAVYGERVLLHDHVDEQPFTRDLRGVKVPQGVRSVVVQGRDRRFGYGGKTIEVALPGR